MGEGGISSEAPTNFSAFLDEYLQRLKPKSRERFNLGRTLSHIIVDDDNYFTWYLFRTAGTSFEIGARAMQTEYKERLNGEIETPGLPQEILNELEAISQRVQESDWADQDTFFSTYLQWDSLKGRLVDELGEKYPELNRAITYYRRINAVAGKAYADSLGYSKQ